MSTYSEQLKDPRWQKKRLEVLERAGWACEVCFESDKTMHVHHAFYQWGNAPWEYDSATLHAVCDECHDHANDLRRDLQLETARLHLAVQFELLRLLATINQSDVTLGDVLVLIDEWKVRVKEESDKRTSQADPTARGASGPADVGVLPAADK